MNRHHWLEIAEYASLATSAAGTLAAVASQQVVYAAAPLTLTLSLNLANRHRFQQQTQHYASSTVTKVQQAVNSLDRKIQALPSNPVDLDPITQSLSQLEQKTQQLTQQFDSRPETRTVTQLTEQFTTLALRLDELPNPINSSIAQLSRQISDFPPPFDPSALEQRLGELEQKSTNLRTDYVKRLVPAVKRLQSDKAHNQEVIAKLTDQLNTLALRLDNLPSPPESMDLSGIQGEVSSLNDQLATLADELRTRPETGAIERLNMELLLVKETTVELEERIQRLSETPKQLQEIEHLTTKLDEKIEHLLNYTHNLDEMQQQLNSLQQMIAGTAKLEDFEGLLHRLREEFSGQVDFCVEKQLVEFNHLLQEIRPDYKYELVLNRAGSRGVLFESLEQAQQRLILVCPWLSCHGANSRVTHKCKELLEKGVRLEIGWGHLRDMKDGDLGVGFKYDALDAFERLQGSYPGKCQLKLLGTHEKFLVCDRSFAMLGSHNFLSSGTSTAERELGLRTNDPRIIEGLISRFDRAKELPDFSRCASAS